MIELHSSVLYAFAGISFFMYGMTLASKYLQRLSANRIRDLLGSLSKRPYLGVFVGIALTFLIQSSGAVTSMLVGLGTAGVISLRQVMGVILGTAIGTTITVQLLSLNIAQYGLAVFTWSFVVFFVAEKRVIKNLSGVLMGFGFLFFGLELIGIGTATLKDSANFVEYAGFLSRNPLIAILITSIFTAVVHSSAATIGLAMALASSGVISFIDAIYWVYGANIGTTATALLASTGGNYVGRRVAWAHCFFKVIGVLAFFFFTDLFAQQFSQVMIERDIANAHTVFNVILAALFFPFIGIGAKIVERLFLPRAGEKEFSVKYINRGDFQSSSVILAHAHREIMRMGDIVSGMVRDSIEILQKHDPELEESIRERDNRVDLLNREISLHLTESLETEGEETEQQSEFFRLISFASDLESAADVIDKSIIGLAQKKHHLKVNFSQRGCEELMELHAEVLDVVAFSMSCFQMSDKDLAAKVIYHKRKIRKLERQLKEAHFERLATGSLESINSSSIHLDVLSDYRRIVGLMANHVYSFLKDGDKYNIVPRKNEY